LTDFPAAGAGAEKGAGCWEEGDAETQSVADIVVL